jgi:phenylpyruvate tautomerase PptA (4-oxalocrotonate tautomerase family)
MPLAKIHVVKGRYDQARIAKVSEAIQAALMNTLHVPPDDFYHLIFELPENRFLHTPSFVGMQHAVDCNRRALGGSRAVVLRQSLLRMSAIATRYPQMTLGQLECYPGPPPLEGAAARLIGLTLSLCRVIL